MVVKAKHPYTNGNYDRSVEDFDVIARAVRVAEAEGGDVSLHEEAHMIGHYFGVDGQLHEILPHE